MAVSSTRSRLAYEVRYGRPYEFANFTAILEQAGITDTDFFEMYRTHQLEEFLVKIGKAAKNISFSNDQELMDFAVARLLTNNSLRRGIDPRPFIWTNFAPFYESIDLRLYEHIDPRRLEFPMFFGHVDSEAYHKAHATISCIQ